MHDRSFHLMQPFCFSLLFLFGLAAALAFSAGSARAALLADEGNLIQDGSCNAAYAGDPQLGPLADNGGAT